MGANLRNWQAAEDGEAGRGQAIAPTMPPLRSLAHPSIVGAMACPRPVCHTKILRSSTPIPTISRPSQLYIICFDHFSCFLCSRCCSYWFLLWLMRMVERLTCPMWLAQTVSAQLILGK